ncbi:MAG: AgmX/PglI C-terminal domain-containing protein [Myxococcota bacterium]|nr:AgmX/PglI C-terminal domain-containing protein [Myxococcota bacterium]
MKRMIGILLAGLALVGCGGGEASVDEAETSRATSGSESARGRDDGVAITGLMGTIERGQVESTLNPRMGRFMRCFSQRMGDVEYLAGEIRMSFRIHTDGSVAWVFPTDSDIGDREAERCILDVARSARFPRPRGGEAEFSWGFGLDAAEDVRPPLNWSAEALGERSGDVSGLARQCGARASYRVTAYIAPGGAVQAVGGTMPSAEDEQTLECILEQVRAWEMPDPGSYAAKITFEVR